MNLPLSCHTGSIRLWSDNRIVQKFLDKEMQIKESRNQLKQLNKWTTKDLIIEVLGYVRVPFS